MIYKQTLKTLFIVEKTSSIIEHKSKIVKFFQQKPKCKLAPGVGISGDWVVGIIR